MQQMFHSPLSINTMIIVITKSEFFTSEAEQIESLLRSGKADVIHIRKPEASESDVERLICSLPKELYGRLVLHDHHQLALRYGLRGIHLNSRNPERLQGFDGTVSVSCHSIAELAERKKEGFDYLSLSPIFDSISKVGYKAAFTPEELEDAHSKGIIDSRVMALGGVTFNRVKEVLEMGFGGAMILGDAWK